LQEHIDTATRWVYPTDGRDWPRAINMPKLNHPKPFRYIARGTISFSD